MPSVFIETTIPGSCRARGSVRGRKQHLSASLWFCLSALGALSLGGCCFSKSAATPPPAGGTAISVADYRDGTWRNASVDSDAPLFNDLVAYFNSPGFRGGRLNWVD